MCTQSLQSCPTPVTLWTVYHRAPLSMRFPGMNIAMGRLALFQDLPNRGWTCISASLIGWDWAWGAQLQLWLWGLLSFCFFYLVSFLPLFIPAIWLYVHIYYFYVFDELYYLFISGNILCLTFISGGHPLSGNTLLLNIKGVPSYILNEWVCAFLFNMSIFIFKVTFWKCRYRWVLLFFNFILTVSTF